MILKKNEKRIMYVNDMKVRIFYEADIFDCDVHNEDYLKAVDEFDKNFPYMEKKVLPHQWM